MFLHNFFEIFIINWLKFLEFCGIIHSYSYELCEKLYISFYKLPTYYLK